MDIPDAKAPRPSVLVVDDDPVARSLVAATLSSAGMAVVTASNGPQALELLGQGSFAAVVLDNHMPGMSGLEVLAEVRSRPHTATLPVILVTSDEQVADRVRGLGAGANDYVAKPFHPDELVARVAAQLRWQSTWVELIAAHRRERAAVAGALAELTPGATVEAMAALVCGELQAIGRFSGACVVAVHDGELLVPLNDADLAGWQMRTNRPLSRQVSRHLLERAHSGPWIEGSDGDAAAAPIDGLPNVAALACAPLHYSGRLLGILMLGAHPPGGRAGASQLAQSLAETIDFAAVVGGLLGLALVQRGDRGRNRQRLEDVVRERAFDAVFQPLIRLSDGVVVGHEALTRFRDRTPPELRFAEASTLGLGVELELATLDVALEASAALPAGGFLSVNVSPGLVLAEGGLQSLLDRHPRPLVLELTEHDPVDHYAELRVALSALAPKVEVSVDDAGSGFASLRHILELAPQFIKLDRGWVDGIEADPARQALVAGLRHFASATGCCLIAEGIETDQAFDTLRELGVELGQGFLVGRPAPG